MGTAALANADDLIAEIGRRYGPDGDLCRSLRLSRDGRLGGAADPDALLAAETRIAKAPESDFHGFLKTLAGAAETGADGLACFWHGLALMGANRWQEAFTAFEKSAAAPRALSRHVVAPFLSVLGKSLGSQARPSVPATPAPKDAGPILDWTPGGEDPFPVRGSLSPFAGRRSADRPEPTVDSHRADGMSGGSMPTGLPFQADYAAHPAFAPHIRWKAGDAGSVDEAVRTLNKRLLDLESSLVLKQRTLRQAIESVTAPVGAVVDMIRAANERNGADFAPFAERFRLELMWILVQDLAYFERRNSYQPVIRNPREMWLRNELAERGYLEFDLSRDELQAVRAAFRPQFEGLEDAYRRGGRSREQLSVNDIGSDPRMLVCGLFERRGINKAVSDVRHEAAQAIGMAAELSPHDNRWWHSRYEDVGLPTNKAAYFHNDEGRDVYKAIVYLDDVDADRGPFGFLPESYALERPRFEWASARAVFNTLVSPDLKRLMAGMDEERGPLTSQAARRFFGMLPPCLRVNSHFGFDVLDGSPLSERLLAAERRVTAPAGRVIVFDGSRVVHRGGQVRAGMRRALQVVFEVERSNGRDLNRELFGPREA